MMHANLSARRRRPIAWLLGTVGLALSAASCERLLVEPASSPAAGLALSLALAPASAGVAAAEIGDADGIRIRVTDAQDVLLDTLYRLTARQPAVFVPVPFPGSEAALQVRAELRRGLLPIFRGIADVQLRQGRITDATIAFSPATTVPLAPATQISAGIYHSCAVGSSSGVFCWGINENGQLGDNSLLTRPLPVPTGGTPTAFRLVGAGYLNTCGLAADGRAFCWGSNQRGTLGNSGSASGSAVPVPVSSTLTFQSLSVGGLHACGLTGTGAAYCWGFNGFGQLGVNSTADATTPSAVAGGLRFRAISAGYLHTCAITTTDQLHCWGLNASGQLGDATTQNRAAPVRVAGAQTFESVSAGGLHTCAIGTNRQTFCWGDGRFGQIGNGARSNQTSPVALPGVQLVQVGAGGLHTCGVAADNRAFCWGYNRSGALGDGSRTDRSGPVAVGQGRLFRTVAAGLHHSCGILSDGRAACWGHNAFGQVGDGSRIHQLQPTDVLRVEGSFLPDKSSPSHELTHAVAGLLRGTVDP